MHNEKNVVILASKMSAYCIIYEHNTYDKSDTFCREFHCHTVGQLVRAVSKTFSCFPGPSKLEK